MKKVKMIKTVGSRNKGFTFTVTDRHAEQLMSDGLATEVQAKQAKEDKGASKRETK
jgi:hypothetical protein